MACAVIIFFSRNDYPLRSGHGGNHRYRREKRVRRIQGVWEMPRQTCMTPRIIHKRDRGYQIFLLDLQTYYLHRTLYTLPAGRFVEKQFCCTRVITAGDET